MKVLALATLILALSGCRALGPEVPPWARPVPGTTSPAAPVSSEDAASLTPAPPPNPAPANPRVPAALPPPVALPAPAVPTPPAPSRAVSPPPPPPASPPVPAPAPTVVPAPLPATPGPPLTASLPPAEVRRLQDEAQRGIEETERLLRQLDGRPLAPKDLETLRLAQGLVEQARRALGGQEYERAANLAAKARTLADDLSTRR
jgi:hypothetical protein